MKIILNGEQFKTKCKKLDELVITVGYNINNVATAANGEFIKINNRHKYILKDNDQIEIVIPMVGG